MRKIKWTAVVVAVLGFFYGAGAEGSTSTNFSMYVQNFLGSTASVKLQNGFNDGTTRVPTQISPMNKGTKITVIPTSGGQTTASGDILFYPNLAGDSTDYILARTTFTNVKKSGSSCSISKKTAYGKAGKEICVKVMSVEDGSCYIFLFSPVNCRPQ